MLSLVKALTWASCLAAVAAVPMSSTAEDDPSLAGLNAVQRQNIQETKEYFNNRVAAINVVKTTKLANGQLVDWIMRDSQGDIATPPPAPKGKRDNLQKQPVAIPMLEVEGAERGPEGSVPVARYNLDLLDANISLKQRMSKGGLPTLVNDDLPPNNTCTRNDTVVHSAATSYPHWYASSAQAISNHGGAGTFSMFDAFVETPSTDFSLMQTAVIRYNVPVAGSSSTTAQTVESGWINYPSQVQAPHLFSFYTTNGYSSDGNSIGGWNRDQDGWVQTDSSIFPGTPFSPTSTDGGSQYDLEIRYYLYQGNWWLWVVNRYIGYYPASLFTKGGVSAADTLESGSSQINFYGEIYQSEDHITTTDMGSGEFPESGFGHSAYIHNIVYTDANGLDYNYDGSAQIIQSDTSRYQISSFFNSGSNWGSYVYLGGPGAGGVVGG
jgi:hypothetical protein